MNHRLAKRDTSLNHAQPLSLAEGKTCNYWLRSPRLQQLPSQLLSYTPSSLSTITRTGTQSFGQL
jgi:hypothetical protein